MGPLEKAANLIALQNLCTRAAGRVIMSGPVRAYCEPRWAPDHVHLVVNDRDDMDPERDIIAEWDSIEGGDAIPGAEEALAEMRKIIPGASVSIVVCR